MHVWEGRVLVARPTLIKVGLAEMGRIYVLT